MWYLQLIFFILFVIIVFSFFSLAPRVPTQKKDLERINEIIAMKKWEKLLEIWCGTAQVSLYLAKKNPYNSIVGIELSPLFYIISKIKVYYSGQKNIKILYGNGLNQVLSNFDILYVFGLPETITNKLFPKIQNITNQNFRLFSYAFQMQQNRFLEIKHTQPERYCIYEYRTKSESI